MIAEDLLERGLHDAAAEFDLPDGAVDDLRERLAPADVEPSAARRSLHLPRTRGAWLGATAAAVVVLIIVAIAVGGGASTSQRSTTNGPAFAAKTPSNATSGESAGGGGGVASSAAGSAAGQLPALAPVPRAGAGEQKVPSLAPSDSNAKVVKTGEMDLQAGKGQVPHVLDRLTALATLERGYVADSHTAEGSDPSGAVTLRVPVEAFEATLSQVRGLGAKVLSQQTSGEDVTASYVDLQARIRALSATRATFERLLLKATTIEDTLAVQSRITDVQTQIEQLQGQLHVLSDKADFAALTVTVDEKVGPAPVRHEQSGLAKAFHRSVDRFLGGIEAIIGILGPLLLIVLVAGVLVLAARLGYRRVRRQLV